MSEQLSHINEKGNAEMVSIKDKLPTKRKAVAQSIVILPDEVLDAVKDNEILTAKGPVFQTANIAGVMASKQTSNLIPLCHPLSIDQCKLKIELKENNKVYIRSTVHSTGTTGVEMEALTACTVAALCVYDMCKALSHHIVITETKLLHKSGGKKEYNFE